MVARRPFETTTAELPLDNRREPLAAGRTDRDEAAARSLLGKQLREIRDDPTAGGSERVAGGERRAVDVQPRSVDSARWLGQAEPGLREARVRPRGKRGEHLRGECFVNLVEVKVADAEAGPPEQFRHREHWRH